MIEAVGVPQERAGRAAMDYDLHRKAKGLPVGIKVRLNLPHGPIKADNFKTSLDRKLVELIKALARKAAEDDFESCIKKQRH